MCDNDIGEMFLNFMLHEDMRQLCGIDVGGFFPEEAKAQGGQVIVRWARNAMGLRPSPYTCVKFILLGHEVIMGNPNDPENVFQWLSIRLNLPGDPLYDPSVPWVSKVRKDGAIAADLKTYVDDERPSGPTELDAWHAAQRASSIQGMLGIQDAARKRRPPSMEPGAWAGSVCHTSEGKVTVLLSQDRWEKTREIIAGIARTLKDNNGIFDFKKLESERGSLVYVMRTYPAMKPYLRGIHATLDSWRPDRDKEGWKRPKTKKQKGNEDAVNLTEDLVAYDDDQMDWCDKWPDLKLLEHRRDSDEGTGQRNVPQHVRAVPRLITDVEALLELCSSDIPPKRLARPTARVCVRYGFGDASGVGYGSSILIEGRGILWETGLWEWSIKEESSSNYKELKNIVDTLHKYASDGFLRDTEIWMFTDNSVAESAYFRGTSKSRQLFELVLQLRKLEMAAGCRIFVIHVTGTRMIAQGTDGLSRGDQNAGVMSGRNMLDYVPLHRSAVERSASVEPWV